MAGPTDFNNVLIFTGLALAISLTVRLKSFAERLGTNVDFHYFIVGIYLQILYSMRMTSTTSGYIRSKGPEYLLVLILCGLLVQYLFLYTTIPLVVRCASSIASGELENNAGAPVKTPVAQHKHRKTVSFDEKNLQNLNSEDKISVQPSSVKTPVAQHKHRKTVSFDEKNLQNLNSEDKISVQPSSLSIDRQYLHMVLQKVGIVVGVFVLSTFMIPELLLLASTTKIYELEGIILVKTDHFLFAPLAFCLCNMPIQLWNFFRSPPLKSFPKCTAIAIIFTWFYGYIVICIGVYFLGLSKDVFHGLLENFDRNEYSQSPISALVVDFVRHAAQKCLGAGLETCTVDNLWVGQVVASSLAVFNFFCFLVVPLLIWVLVVEMKIAPQLRNTN